MMQHRLWHWKWEKRRLDLNAGNLSVVNYGASTALLVGESEE